MVSSRVWQLLKKIKTLGCVVWKKNRSSSSSKNPKRTNNVLPKQQFPNDSATLQIAESSKCTIQETTSPSDRKDINSSGDSSIIHSSSDNIVTIPPLKGENLSVLTSGMSTTCKPEVISSEDPELRPSTVEHQALNHVESQKSVSGFESQPIVQFQAPRALPEPYVKSESPDEDDLPEFEFNNTKTSLHLIRMAKLWFKKVDQNFHCFPCQLQ
ncbi:hypothetical protein QJS10_CPA05g01386 [Acorus calamus]|uniref:Uncharacterized protein n=1 Tax=Acorus calamus TaxID=4465 RepID=A0AAV9ETK3_ACOCL|nr:hypothetical protein QJS10_CPA05g01386 [Acorus calamus]